MKPGSASMPFFGIQPAIVDKQSKVLKISKIPIGTYTIILQGYAHNETHELKLEIFGGKTIKELGLLKI